MALCSVHTGVQDSIARFQFGNGGPKAWRVIEMDGVAELMNHDISHQFRRKKKQLAVEAYGSLAGTASPSAFLFPDLGFLKNEACFLTDPVEPWNEVPMPLVFEPEAQKLPAHCGVIHIAYEFQM